MLRVSTGAGKIGDTPAKDTPLRKTFLREQGVRYRAILHVKSEKCCIPTEIDLGTVLQV